MKEDNVRKVIFRLWKDLHPHPDRGAAIVLVTVDPSHAAPYKRGARWGTGTNVQRVHSAPTNPSRTD
jgi:hypothetical protein